MLNYYMCNSPHHLGLLSQDGPRRLSLNGFISFILVTKFKLFRYVILSKYIICHIHS